MTIKMPSLLLILIIHLWWKKREQPALAKAGSGAEQGKVGIEE